MTARRGLRVPAPTSVKWAQLGGHRSFLGYPVTDELGCPDGVGRFNHFEGGSIYWTPATGAHEVHGAIRALWAKHGWETGEVGYPLSDEMDFQGGRMSQFQRGQIIWNSAEGARIRRTGQIDEGSSQPTVDDTTGPIRA